MSTHPSKLAEEVAAMPDDDPFLRVIEETLNVRRAVTPSRVTTPAPHTPMQVLWQHISAEHRKELEFLADGIEWPQAGLERILGVNGRELRALHQGLSRICNRLARTFPGVKYPLRQRGSYRKLRKFFMSHEAARDLKSFLESQTDGDEAVA